MKKIISAILIIFTLLFCLTSCDFSEVKTLSSFKMSSAFSWLAETNSTEIIKVEQISSPNGVAPGTRITCYYSENSEIIESYLTYYGELRVTYKPIPEFVGGGKSTKTIFTLEDGSTRELICSPNGGYVISLGYLEPHLDISPKLDCEGEMDVFYRFTTHDDSIKVYTCDESHVLLDTINSGASDLSFIIHGEETPADIIAEKYLETDFGKVYIYSDELCYIESAIEDIYSGYYELYESTFDEIISKR